MFVVSSQKKRNETRRDGFSLVELLVVVVIIGVLASVGFVAYQAYIDTSRDGVSESNWNSLKRMLEVDEMSINSGISARSKMSENASTATTCKLWKAGVITEMNTQKDNPFGGVSVAIDGNALNSPPASTITWKRGEMLVACADECSLMSSAAFALQVCVCTATDTCITDANNTADNVCTTPPAARVCP